MTRTTSSVALVLFAWIGVAAVPASAGAHTWDVFEIFSNADGTIQFIELREMQGTAGETGVGSQFLTTASGSSFDIPNNVASPTTNKHLLFGTPAFKSLFAALIGAPQVDFTIPANFFSVNGDTISYGPYDARSFGPGELPTNGTDSLNLVKEALEVGINTPRNYAGATGTIDASPAPPAVPGMRVAKLLPDGSSLSVSWDSSVCGSTTQSIVYGDRSQLPLAPGGTFVLAGSVCGVGAAPYTWTPTPTPVSGSLLWWLILALDGAGTEGSWGLDGNDVERVGPGTGSSSGQCGVTTKDASNTCGQ